MALRRWKPFFPAFGAIDSAIEAAAEGCSRDAYREVRSELVEMLCDAAESDDDVRAEELCRLLDGSMAEALLTLGAVPVAVTPTILATTDVAKAIRGLMSHDAGKVRALAHSVVAQWTASVEAEGDRLLKELRDHEVAATVLQGDGSVKQAAKISDLECPDNKKMSPGGDRVRNDEHTGDAKRKHPGAGAGAGACYGEDDDVKRRRKDPEKMVEHRTRKMEPDVKSRSRVSSRRWMDERRRFSRSTRHRRF